MKKEIVSILGCGWYGLAVAKALLIAGYVVKGSTTSEHKLVHLKEHGIDPYLLNFGDHKTGANSSFFECDVLIISIPPRKNNNEAAIGFVSQIEHIIHIATMATVKNVILISSTGIYQDGNFIVNETISPAPVNETGKSLLTAETLLKQTTEFESTIIRFGGLIGPNRNLAKHFAGKVGIVNGKAPINLIHLDDCIGLTLAILVKRKFGHLYHGVCPDHPSRADYYTQLCKETGLEKPEFIDELISWKQIDSLHVPALLEYKWQVRF